MSNMSEAGSDRIIGSLTFMCIANAPNMRSAIKMAAGVTSDGTQTPISKAVAAKSFSVPTR